jgi:ribosomal protein L40E
MDITKFNKELKTKVALAKSYEKRNEIDSAIKLWLEISEMTLNYSKSRGINATYKNMLINRTKGIVDHIKNLKAGQVEKFLFEEDVYIPEEEVQEEEEASEIFEKEKSIPQKKETKGIRPSEPDVKKETKTVEESNFKNIPKGFKEIQTSTDFTIVTPHDEDYIKKRLSQETNPSQTQKSLPEQERIDFTQPEDSEIMICFACGFDKNPKNAKTCKSCGTLLN